MAERPSEPNGIKPLIRLDSPFQDPVRKAVFSVTGGAIEKLLAIDQINNVYYDICSMCDDRDFMTKCLASMHVSYRVDEGDLERIPKTGRAIVVANHPFGGIEGIVLAHLLHGVREDFKVMANFLLERIDGLRPWMIFVDPFERSDSARVNMKPMKETLRWLRGDGLLGVFPSGEVSHLNLRRGDVSDPPWNETIARFIKMTKAPVVPLYFHGANGLLFQLAGLIHPRLRTALLPKEFINKRDKTIQVRIGNPIPFERLERIESDRELMDYLCMRTYNLRNRPEAERTQRFSLPVRLVRPERRAEIEPPRAAEAIAAEVAALPPEQKLSENKRLSVWYASAAQIPNLLHEIGRQRELTFRAAGEGTGQAIDLDAFDSYYLHLFVWNGEKNELVGAYRLGQTDRILAEHGKKGLYTSTLFRYRGRLLDSISPALEMGRSFIRQEYQRNFSSLLLLWKGIGHFVVRNPRYKILFGPVSIPADYHRNSQELMVQFLKANNALPALARMVKARHPLRINPLKKWKARKVQVMVEDLDEVESLISDIETNLQGVPVLLRQYLKLGGKLLGFNIDSEFGNVLDGLILVDLTQSDPAMISRYLGREGAISFRAHHGLTTPEIAKTDVAG